MFNQVLIAGISFVLVVSLQTNSNAADAKVEKGKKVKVEYTLTVDGKVVDSSEGKEPLSYVQGEGQLIKGFESQIEGMKVGESKKIVVAPKDGYGDSVPDAIKEFPKDKFPAEPPMQVGMVVEFNSPDGNTIPGIISEIKDTGIMVNFNHPLAGKTLNFDAKVVGIE